MTDLDYHLDRVQGGEYEPQRDDIVLCNICDRKVDVLNKGKGPLICCGKPMVKIGEAIDRNPVGHISRAERML